MSANTKTTDAAFIRLGDYIQVIGNQEIIEVCVTGKTRDRKARTVTLSFDDHPCMTVGEMQKIAYNLDY